MTENKISTSSKNSSIQTNQEINELIENNMKLVGFVSKRFPTDLVSREDLIAAGYIGLIKAAQTFDKEKGYKFATFAVVVISNEMKRAIANVQKNKEVISLQEVLFCDKERNMTLEDILQSPINLEEQYLEKEEYQELYSAIKQLDKTEQEWIYLYYGFYDKRYTGTEIAKMYGINQSTFSRKLPKIIEKLRIILLNEYKVIKKQKVYKKEQ